MSFIYYSILDYKVGDKISISDKGRCTVIDVKARPLIGNILTLEQDDPDTARHLIPYSEWVKLRQHKN